MTANCGFEWCGYAAGGARPGHVEHNWTDSVPANLGRKNQGRAYVFGIAYDGAEFNDEVLIGIEDDDESAGSEAWLSIEHAEQLRDALSMAIACARRQEATAMLEAIRRVAKGRKA